MSRYSHERNGTDMGEPSMVGRTKAAKGNGAPASASFKSGSPLKGVPDDDNRDLPKFPGYDSFKGPELSSKRNISRGNI